jgi:two-component system, OmpR family, phosphate regulon response regulator PhoB
MELHKMKKILIVDDSKAIRELVIATLEEEQYQVFEASDGAKAVAIALLEKPDLVLMDVMLPGKINGIEATKIIKRNNAIENCAVIILTGTNDEKLREKGLMAGASDFFIKPFSPLKLLRKIDMLLGDHVLPE